MGFKFKRVDLVAGSEEWPTGISDPVVATRELAVLKKSVQAIIDCDCGWQLDASKNVTIDDVVAIPTRTSGSTSSGLFLVNSSSGCKLFVSYFGYNPNYGIADFSGNGTSNFRFLATATDSVSCGLCMSMIPAGSSNAFGDPTTTSFLPSDATRIIGTVNYRGANKYPFAGDPSAGYVYSWGFFVTQNVVCVACAKNQGTRGNFNVPAYAIGRIFGVLAHSEDSLYTSKYGVLNFRVNDSSPNSEGIYDPTYMTTGLLGQSVYIYGVNPFSTSTSFINTDSANSGAFTNASGAWINGTDRSSYTVVCFPSDFQLLSNYVFNSTNTGKSRWSPYAMAVVSVDSANSGVVPGDGFKGYIDTDLFRAGVGTYGQMFDEGNFICISGDYRMLIGWDPDNDPLVGE